MNQLHFISSNTFYKDVLEYIYYLGEDHINNFFYVDEQKYKNYRHNNHNQVKGKVLIPGEIEITLDYKNTRVHCKHEIILDNLNNIMKLQKGECGGSTNDILFCKITLIHGNKDILTSFVDDARLLVKERIKQTRNKSSDIIRVYYYKDFWYLFSKIPKRPIDTLYLKENQLSGIVNSITEFFSEQEKKDYIAFGIPYKKVFFLYGVPGSGKTSTINTLASYFSCDVHILPLSTDMDDSCLVEAFGSVSSECDINNEDNRKIIIIEDIDCIFKDRKEGDHLKNKITLQGLLNCMDGFTCVEGALIFITANNPETLDEAVIRSCRVDYKLELGYADKFQIGSMFQRFLPNQMVHFDKFYNTIRHKKITTAMLQEFLFFNRKCFNILEIMDDFNKIIDKNNPDNLDRDKDKGGNHYM